MTECIFCKIVKGQIPSFKVYENDRVFAFEDINPIRPGHTLIIPKKHAENIWEMTEEDMVAVHVAAKKIARAIRKALNAEGIACLQLSGKAVNQVVMHYHYHLIPQSAGDPPLTMTEWTLTPGNMDAVRRTGERIAQALG